MDLIGILALVLMATIAVMSGVIAETRRTQGKLEQYYDLCNQNNEINLRAVRTLYDLLAEKEPDLESKEMLAALEEVRKRLQRNQR